MADAKTNDGYLVSKGYSYYVFALLFLLYMFDYIDRQIIVSLFPHLKEEWGLTDTQCGSLVSAVYLSILIFSFPVSILVDRWSRKNSIGIMAVLWSIATAACAFTHNFTHLFIARTAIGIGEAGYAPGGTALISASFPQRLRAQMMGLWNASIPLGSALGIVMGGFIAQYFGWRYAFGIVAIPGLIVAILFFWVKDYKTVALTKYKQEQGSSEPAQRMGIVDIALSVLATPSLIFAYLGFAANMFMNSALMTWLPSYYERTDGCPMSEASLKGGSVMAMAILGAPLGGFIVDRWGKRMGSARMVFGGISSIITGSILIVGFSMFEGTAQYIVFMFAGIFASAFIPGIAAVTQDVVHPGLRAISYSINVVVMHVLGSSLGPIVVGAISDFRARVMADSGLDYAEHLHFALTLLPIASVLGGILFFIGSIWYVRDLARVDHVELKVD